MDKSTKWYIHRDDIAQSLKAIHYLVIAKPT